MLTATATAIWASLGDSLTSGTAGEPAWSDLAAARLAATHPDITHANFAFPGARARDVLAAQVPEALTLRPALVTLIAGANDVVLDVRPDLESVAVTLEQTFSRIAATLPATKLVTATYPDVTRFFPLRPRSRARVKRGMDALNDTIRQLSHGHGATLVELAGHPGEHDRDNFAGDGLHASSLGAARAAETLAAAIARELGISPRASGARPC